MSGPDLDIMVDCPSHGQQPVCLYGCAECVLAEHGPRPMVDIVGMVNGMDWRLPDGSIKLGRRQ